MNTKYLFYIIINLVVVAILYLEISNRGQPQPSNWEPKIDNQSAITVTITPIDIFSQSKEWKFDIVMDTHSVELDQDMTKVTVLIDDSGKEYGPVKWEGTPAGGHHREGVLIFNPITPAPKLVELKITGIADTVRTFNWQLK